jgi:hypothetical protein
MADGSSQPGTPIHANDGPLITASSTPLLDGALKRADALERGSESQKATQALSSTAQADRAVLMDISQDLAADQSLPQVSLTGSGQPEMDQLPRAITPRPEPITAPAPPQLRPAEKPPAARAVHLEPSRTASRASTAGPGPGNGIVGKSSVPGPSSSAPSRELVGPPVLADRAQAPASEPRIPPPSPPRSPARPVDDAIAFAVSEPRLCRKILGFGAFEPLEESQLRAGQALLVYCELTGLRYQTREKTHVSRLASRAELHSKDGARVWEQSFGEAEDECRSRRRDNFVGCRLTLPESLLPGDYRLKLIQTDLVARQSASAELPLTIVR